MNRNNKSILILYSFILLYASSLIIFGKYNLLISIIVLFFISIMFFSKNIKSDINSLGMGIIIKIILFLIFLIFYFFIERILITILLFGIDNIGFLQSSGLIKKDYKITTFDLKIWSFIFTLYYPIYIFIFLKPFVNHLDKSIKNKNKGK